MSLYHKYRPTKFSEVVGQESTVETLQSLVKSGKVPQAILFTGPSGTGKTTLARILRKRIRCSDMDFREINAAEVRGIDGVREIQERMGLAPMGGGVRVYLIDEAQQLTRDAQSALLKMLEDPPRHVHFMLATTDPQKLLPTIRTRCTEVAVCGLNDGQVKGLLEAVRKAEGKDAKSVSVDVIDKIVEASNGSARKALVLLDQVINLDSEDKQLEAINKGDSEKQAIDLCRALIDKKDWSVVSKIVKGLEAADPEQTRRAVIGYARAVLLGTNKKSHAQAYLVIEAFEAPYYDVSHAGLARDAYEVVNGG